MIESLKHIDRFNLNFVISEFLTIMRENENLIGKLGVKTKDNGYGSHFIQPHNSFFSLIIATAIKSEFTALTFYCKMSVTISDLLNLYHIEKENYNRYSSHYEYLLAPNTKEGFRILIESPSVLKNQDNAKIDKLTILLMDS